MESLINYTKLWNGRLVTNVIASNYKLPGNVIKDTIATDLMYACISLSRAMVTKGTQSKNLDNLVITKFTNQIMANLQEHRSNNRYL